MLALRNTAFFAVQLSGHARIDLGGGQEIRSGIPPGCAWGVVMGRVDDSGGVRRSAPRPPANGYETSGLEIPCRRHLSHEPRVAKRTRGLGSRCGASWETSRSRGRGLRPAWHPSGMRMGCGDGDASMIPVVVAAACLDRRLMSMKPPV